MNKKGFTLTELIVTIALVGIISIIAFPVISKLKSDNIKEKDKQYIKIIENAAKLYVDKYKADLNYGDRILVENLINEGYLDQDALGEDYSNITCTYNNNEVSCRKTETKAY